MFNSSSLVPEKRTHGRAGHVDNQKIGVVEGIQLQRFAFLQILHGEPLNLRTGQRSSECLTMHRPTNQPQDIQASNRNSKESPRYIGRGHRNRTIHEHAAHNTVFLCVMSLTAAIRAVLDSGMRTAMRGEAGAAPCSVSLMLMHRLQSEWKVWGRRDSKGVEESGSVEGRAFGTQSPDSKRAHSGDAPRSKQRTRLHARMRWRNQLCACTWACRTTQHTAPQQPIVFAQQGVLLCVSGDVCMCTRSTAPPCVLAPNPHCLLHCRLMLHLPEHCLHVDLSVCLSVCLSVYPTFSSSNCLFV